MTTAVRQLFVPYRLATLAALAAAVAVGAACPLLGGTSMLFKAVFAASLVGIVGLLVIPSRRLALVCGWVLIFPLSLEKVFPVLQPTFPRFFIPPIVLSGGDLILGLLIASLILESVTRRQNAFVWPSAAAPFFLLVAWVGVSFVLTTPTSEGVLQLLHWTKMAVFLVVMTSAIRSREELLAVILAAAGAVLLQAILVGLSYVFKRHFGFSPRAAGEALLAIPTGTAASSAATIVRATGTLGHPNQQAMYQAMFTVPVFALFMVRNWMWRIFAAVLLLTSGCALIFTFSRTSWISCSVATAVILGIAFRYQRISRRAVLGLCLGSIGALGIVGAFSGLILTRLTKADDGASLSRVHLALLALEHVSHRPITGVGPGNFVNAKLASSAGPDWARSDWLPRGVEFKARYIDDLELGEVTLDGKSYYTSLPAHNKYLLVAAELGLVGLALFLWFQWRLLQTVLAGLRTSDALLWWAGAALLGAFAATLVEFMLELFYDDKTMLMPLFVDVLVICFGRIVAAETARETAS